MSDERFSNRSRRSRDVSAPARMLDALVAEAKVVDAVDLHVDAKTDAMWARMEERLMATVEREKPALLHDLELARGRGGDARSSAGGSRAWLRGGVVVLAAAAAVALFVRKDHEPLPLVDPGVVHVDGASASSLRATEGAGEVRVNRVLATPGYIVRSGDTIDVDGTRAVFERSRKVTWLLEGTTRGDAVRVRVRAPGEPGPSARAHVKSAGESLVVGLESGAIEAQVTPVPTGEAFAVDVATDQGVVRVAVHGTHLRVVRNGTHVTVDLTEGVVSIGVPPRIGVTIGTLVTAPAHVELDATDLSTLQVDHAAQAVRAAIPLGPREAPVVGRVDPPSPAALPASPAHPSPLAPPAKGGPRASEGALDSPPVAKSEPLSDPLNDANDAPARARAIERARARDTIVSAVRDCATARGRSGEVHVTVTSNLNLHVSPGGEVETAQFSPPLLPEIQTCAAQAIYRTRLAETGLVTIPIEYSY